MHVGFGLVDAAQKGLEERHRVGFACVECGLDSGDVAGVLLERGERRQANSFRLDAVEEEDSGAGFLRRSHQDIGRTCKCGMFAELVESHHWAPRLPDVGRMVQMYCV